MQSSQVGPCLVIIYLVTSQASPALPEPQLPPCKKGSKSNSPHASLRPAEPYQGPRKTRSQRALRLGMGMRSPCFGAARGCSPAQPSTPSSALVQAFREAHRKQEEQCRKLEQQMERMEARQAEELAVLEATARALGERSPPCPPPQLGETFL